MKAVARTGLPRSVGRRITANSRCRSLLKVVDSGEGCGTTSKVYNYVEGSSWKSEFSEVCLRTDIGVCQR